MYHHIENDNPQHTETVGMTHYELSNYVFPDVKSGWNSSSGTTAPAADNDVSSPMKNTLNNSLDNTTLRIASIELSNSGNNNGSKRQKQQDTTTSLEVTSLTNSNGNSKKRGRDQIDLLRNLDAEKLKEALVDCLTRQTSSVDVRQKWKTLESTTSNKSLSTPTLPSMTSTSMFLSDVMEQYDSLNHSMFYNASPLKRQPFEMPPQLLHSLETSVSEMYANAARLTVRDYNQEFQEIKDSINRIIRSRDNKTQNPCFANPDPQIRLLFERSEKLMEDFFYAAKTYSRIIVSEFNLPDDQKTIKPARSGKYLHKGIMFRFAMDKLVMDSLGRKQWVFGGDTRNDILAIKAAAKEFTALSMFISVDCMCLCYPIMAIIDYKGYRVIVTPVLPIDKTTIVYGSNDEGRTVHSDIPEVNSVVKEIASRLRLKEHKVGRDPQTAKVLSTPGNFQVHLGKDNRYYAVGFGRIFPPEAPCVDPNIACTLSEKRSIFHKFLRPEFHMSPSNEVLSPDAFSEWSKCDEERQENEDRVRDATARLFNEVIPAFAADLEREVDLDFNLPYDALTEHIITRVRLVTRARFAGVNMRHLGRVRANLQSESHRRLLLSLCVARVVKRKIRDEMRRVLNRMKGTPSDLPFREVIVLAINTLLGHTKQSNNFWQTVLKKQLEDMFHYVLNEQEQQAEFDLRSMIDIKTVLVGILTSTCIIIKPAALIELMNNTYSFELLSSDLTEIVPRIRITGKFYVIRSKLMRLSALESTNQDSIARLLNTAHSICTIASFSSPKCPAICFEFSSLLLVILRNQMARFSQMAKDVALSEGGILSNEHIQDLAVDIEANFDIAFGRTEDSISCIASSFNLLQWAELAVLYAEWKSKFGHHEMAKAYLDQRDCVVEMESNMTKTCGTEIISLAHCAEAKRLVAFRESTRIKFESHSRHKCGRIALLRCTFRFGSFQDLICMGWRYG